MIKLKRIYDKPGKEDGFRILVDRLWPRGLSKEKAKVDLWLKDIGPSRELRKWFGHDPAKCREFKKRYFAELALRQNLLAEIRAKAAKGKVTLLFGAKDADCNNAVALNEYLAKDRL